MRIQASFKSIEAWGSQPLNTCCRCRNGQESAPPEGLWQRPFYEAEACHQDLPKVANPKRVFPNRHRTKPMLVDAKT